MTVPSYKPMQMPANHSQPHQKLALAIPALREAGNLGPLLERALQALRRVPIPWEILVVDDDSRDGTEEIVAAIRRRDARVRLLVRHGQRGLSGAILHGWRYTDATILGAMDADGQHPPAILPNLVEAILSGRDLSVASRYARGGHPGWNPIRRLLSSAAIAAARPLQPPSLHLTDPLSGFFMVRRPCVENILFQATGFKLLLEILLRGSVGAVEELPFTFGARRAGRSKMSPKVAWDYVELLARLYRERFNIPRVPQISSGD